MLSPEQLEQRLDYICGSDVGAICGVNEWKTPVEVWLEKTRQQVAKDISDKPAVKAGNMLEGAVANWFALETGKKIKEATEFYVHKDIPFLGGNIDRLIDGENALLECKTTQSDKGWGAGYSEGDNQIPDSYLCQVIHYCAITNRDVAYIAVLIRGIDFRWFKYERDMALEKLITDKCVAFYNNHIKANICPEPTTEEEVKIALRGRISDETIVADDSTWVALDTLKKIKEQIKALEEAEKSCRNIVCTALKDKQTLVDLNGRILATWKQREGSVRFDAKTFKDANPELYKQFEVKGEPVRTFLIK